MVHLFILLANSSIYLMIAFGSRHIGISMIYCLSYTVIMGFLPGLFYKIPQLTFLVDWVVQTHLLYKDFTQLTTIDQYPMILLVAISTIVLSFLVGVLLFHKTDIK
ncbi:hypothetical protein [Enterococcus saccharolyticus]|uniref:hypothetical protein n=1 Tax=Enterococcus saccharolyticus TaxID=41997 RepID=UPI0039E0AFF0